ncbi:hypothetical protein B0H13DRAFT_1891287 [Mycena leptocephala]|nr:hypothetical protein B0H13DRAFT_1891287 [Mycena leptocephala]
MSTLTYDPTPDRTGFLGVAVSGLYILWFQRLLNIWYLYFFRISTTKLKPNYQNAQDYDTAPNRTGLPRAKTCNARKVQRLADPHQRYPVFIYPDLYSALMSYQRHEALTKIIIPAAEFTFMKSLSDAPPLAPDLNLPPALDSDVRTRETTPGAHVTLATAECVHVSRPARVRKSLRYPTRSSSSRARTALAHRVKSSPRPKLQHMRPGSAPTLPTPPCHTAQDSLPCLKQGDAVSRVPAEFRVRVTIPVNSR